MHYFIYRRYQTRYNRYDDILHRLDIASAISDISKSNAANEVEDSSSDLPAGSRSDLTGIPRGRAWANGLETDIHHAQTLP